MTSEARTTALISLLVALGGFLMGFDASVISGVVGFIETEFALSKIELGWSVASLTLTATIAMMVAGPLSDRLGRRPVLQIAALMFAVSAVASAVAPDFITLVIARMLGGFGVGAALIIAPMYIAEIAPAEQRGKLVSFNQLNIVIGISAAFFSNYLILKLGSSQADWAMALHFDDWAWRWMLGVEALPALLYLVALLFVPESPRWLAMQARNEDALAVLGKVSQSPAEDLAAVQKALAEEAELFDASFLELFKPAMRLVLTIGIAVAVLQQLSGINAVFFYAPMIFEQSGIGTDAAFMQAVLVGLVNLGFTILAMALIDKVGRRPLLGTGLAGIAMCMLILAYGFGSASYSFSDVDLDVLPEGVDAAKIESVQDTVWNSDVAFREAISELLGESVYMQHESALVSLAIDANPTLILFGILGFVASFAMSLGPIMWVLFSELFPNRLRGFAISFVGLINSAVSFIVQLVFPWELEVLGNAGTFFVFGIVALLGFFLMLKILPETKGRSLEELEHELLKA